MYPLCSCGETSPWGGKKNETRARPVVASCAHKKKKCSIKTVPLQEFCGPIIMHGVASQATLVVKNLSANAGHIRDAGLIPRSGRSPGGGDGNALQ